MIGPLVAPTGTSATTLSGATDWTVAARAPKKTCTLPGLPLASREVPWIVTAVPAAPKAGLKSVTTGGGAVTAKANAAVPSAPRTSHWASPRGAMRSITSSSVS